MTEDSRTNSYAYPTYYSFSLISSGHRIPILPPFTSEPRLPEIAEWKSVGEIFDLQGWERSIQKRILEWKDAKAGKEKEELGCWSTWSVSWLRDEKPRGTHMNIGMFPLVFEALLKAGKDVAYTSIS